MSHAVAAPTPIADRSIPAEYRGRARSARARFLAAALETGPLMKDVVSDCQVAYKRRTTNQSSRFVQSIADRCQKIPTAGCLFQSVQLDGWTLIITGTRVTASVAKMSIWEEDAKEIGICLIANTLRLTKKGLYWQAPLLVGASLHAVGRLVSARIRNE